MTNDKIIKDPAREKGLAMLPTINGKNGSVSGTDLAPHLQHAELDRTLRTLRRRFGEEAIRRWGEPARPTVETISTGYPQLDAALGGGWPRGRISDIYGPESSGKTTLCLKVIAESQKRGGLCVFIDADHALDPAYAARCGVKTANLYLVQPACGEEALEIAETMVRSQAAVVVIDSAAGLTPRAEVESDMGDQHAGLQARLMSQALRKLAGPVRVHKTTLIFTNQLRQKPTGPFKSEETPTGGLALRFYASIRLDLRRLKLLREKGTVIGARIKATAVKNKVAPPYRSAALDILSESRDRSDA